MEEVQTNRIDELIMEIKELERQAEYLDLVIKYKESLYLIEKLKEDNEELRRFCNIYLDERDKAREQRDTLRKGICNDCPRMEEVWKQS